MSCAFRTRLILLFASTALLIPAATFGQGLTGLVSGRIQDPSEQRIAGADVVLTSLSTGLERSTKTNAAGEFVFTEVLPGSFDFAVESAGFKKFEQKSIVLSASERLVLNTITLELGQ